MSSPGRQLPPKSADIEAEIYFLRTDEGGRMGPVHTGYRPTHDFGLNGMLNDALHEYIGREKVELGDSTLTLLWFLCPEYQEGRLYPGMESKVQEGNKLVGWGRITKVINGKLAKHA